MATAPAPAAAAAAAPASIAAAAGAASATPGAAAAVAAATAEAASTAAAAVPDTPVAGDGARSRRAACGRAAKHAASLEAAQATLLALHTTAALHCRRVVLPSGEYLSTCSAGPVDAPPLVVAHGWGAGLGLFGRNIDAAAQSYRVHLVDWPGCGGSSRPPLPPPSADVDANVRGAVDYFVEPLAAWARIMTADAAEPGFKGPFRLAGHSQGGYLAAAYARRYPADVSHLLLLSPAGVPVGPSDAELNASLAAMPWGRRTLFGTFRRLWRSAVTPQSIVRAGGSAVGRPLLTKYVTARFPWMDGPSSAATAAYLYELFSAPVGSEAAIVRLLRPGLYAYRPAVEWIPSLRMPTTFMYGDGDWMDWRGGAAAVAAMPPGLGEVLNVPAAGHFLFVENADDFNRQFVGALRRADAATTAAGDGGNSA